MFSAAKNLMASSAAQAYVNNLISRYGVVRDLKIDSQSKTVDVTCTLHGETQPIKVRVDQYLIQERNGRRFLRVTKCTCSRPWVQALVEDFVQGREVEVPGWAASVL